MILAFSDFHFGVGEDYSNFKRWKDIFIRRFSPMRRDVSEVVLNGDILDARFGPMQAINAARGFFEHITKFFPNSSFTYITGNHELDQGEFPPEFRDFLSYYNVDRPKTDNNLSLIKKLNGHSILFTHGQKMYPRHSVIPWDKIGRKISPRADHFLSKLLAWRQYVVIEDIVYKDPPAFSAKMQKKIAKLYSDEFSALVFGHLHESFIYGGRPLPMLNTGTWCDFGLDNKKTHSLYAYAKIIDSGKETKFSLESLAKHEPIGEFSLD